MENLHSLPTIAIRKCVCSNFSVRKARIQVGKLRTPKIVCRRAIDGESKRFKWNFREWKIIPSNLVRVEKSQIHRRKKELKFDSI